MSSNEQQKIKIIHTFQELMGKGNRDDAFLLIDDKAVWHSDEIGAPWSGVHQGIEQIKKHYQNISGTTTHFKRETKEFIEHGDLVIEIGSLSCILNKTGQPFATEYVCLYTVHNNKITSYRIFEDSLKLYRAYFSDHHDII